MTSKGSKATGKTRAPRGAGSLTERPGHPGTWRLRYREGGRTRETTFSGSRSAAATELRRLTALAGNAPPVSEKDAEHTMAEAFDNYVTTLTNQGRSPRTIEGTRQVIDTRLAALAPVRVDAITPDALDRLYGEWTKEGLAPGTVRRWHAIVSRSLAIAKLYGWTDRNAAEDVAGLPPLPVQGGDVPITGEDVARLIGLAEDRGDSDMAAAIHLALATGARRGELCGLRWSDTELDSGTLRIRRNIVRTGTTWTTKSTKSGRERSVRLPERTVTALRALRAERDAANADSVIRLSPDKVTDRFTKLCDLLDIDGATFHDIRHASASYQLAAGVDVVTVTANHGWASTRMLDRYGHSLAVSQDRSAAAMNELLPG
jgi:integrase